MKQLTVWHRSNPFKEVLDLHHVDAGLSVREILATLNIPEVNTIVRIGDRREEDFDAIPTGDACIIITEYPEDPISIGALIAKGFAYFGLQGAGYTALSYGLGTVVSIGVNLALSAALAPKQRSVGGFGDSRAYSFNGVRNEVRPFDPVPIVLGTFRYTPAIAARPYTEVHGRVQKTRTVFAIGMGDYDLAGYRVGETPTSNFREFQIEAKKLTSGDRTLNLYPRAVSEDPLNVQMRDLANGSPVLTFTTTSNEARRIKCTFLSRGLIRYNEHSKPRAHGFILLCRYRRVGDSEWTTFYNQRIERITTSEFFVIAEADTPSEDQYEVSAQLQPIFGANSYTAERNGNGGDVSQLVTDLQWLSLAAFEDTSPVLLDNLTVAAVYAAMDEQPNGTIETFNVEVTSRVPLLDADGNAGAKSATSNPARLCYWLLTGEANARPIPADKIDGVAFYNWQEYCEDNGLEFNGVIDFDLGLVKAFNIVARAGRGSHNMRDGLHSVFVDGLDFTIRQLFTPRNILPDGVTISRGYSEPKHAIRARFPNREANYRTDELIVYNDGYNAGNATLFEVYDSIQGLTEADQVYNFVRYELLQERLRPEVFSWRAPLDAIITQRGDVVRLSHPDVLVGLDSARVLSVSTGGGGAILSATVDSSFTLEHGSTYEVCVRNSSNSITTAAIDNPADPGSFAIVSEFDFTTPLVSGTLSAGDLLAFGPSGSSTVDVLVLSIEPDADFNASITATNAAPEIFSTLAGEEPPEFVSVITVQQGIQTLQPATPEIIGVNKYLLDTGNRAEDTPRVRVEALLIPGQAPNTSPTTGYVALYRENDSTTTASGINPWIQLEDIPASKGRAVFELESSNTFDLRVWAMSANRILSGTFAEVQDSQIIGDALPPTGLDIERVYQIRSTGTVPVLRISWNGPSDQSALRYRIRWSRNGEPYHNATTTQDSYDIVDASPGTYAIEVYTENVLREISEPAQSSFTFTVDTPTNPLRATGLEIEGQGNNTAFVGRDVKLVWRITAPNLSDSLEAPAFGTGADTGSQDPFFRNYQISVHDADTNTLLRTEETFEPFYTYTFEKNAEDGGPRRDLRFDVYVRDINGNLSKPATLTVSNPAPPELAAVNITAGVGTVFVRAVAPVPLPTDLRKYIVWASTTQGFTANDSTKVGESALPFVSFPATAGTTYYIRVAAADDFTEDPDELNLSSELSATTSSVDIADGSITSQKLADLAVTAAKLAEQSVSGTNIVEDAIEEQHIQDLAVGNAAIQNGAITNAKIQDAAISTAKIQTAAITTALIDDASITTAKVDDLAVTNAKISNATIEGGKIANATLTGSKFQSGTITNSLLADNTITGGKIQLATVSGVNIVDSTITTSKFGDLQVTTLKIANNAVTVPASAFTSGNIDVDETYEDVQSVTITTHGQPVFIHIAGEVRRTNADTSTSHFRTRIRVDSSDVYESAQISIQNAPMTYGFSISTTPSAASHTFTFQSRKDGSGLPGTGSVRWTNSSILVLEVQK